MTNLLFSGSPSPRDEIIFEVSGSVRFPAIRKGKYKLIGKELYDLEIDPSEKKDIAAKYPKIVKHLNDRVTAIGKERPALKGTNRLMTPALPWVYGQKENATVPDWVKQEVKKSERPNRSNGHRVKLHGLRHRKTERLSIPVTDAEQTTASFKWASSQRTRHRSGAIDFPVQNKFRDGKRSLFFLVSIAR
jgi:hypothetical protein